MYRTSKSLDLVLLRLFKSTMDNNQHPNGNPSWSDLPCDLLLRIFALVSVMDRVLNISMVCRSWRSACSDPILSSTSLDISELRKYLASKNFAGTAQIELLFKRAINLGREDWRKLVFDNQFDVRDSHLIYAAQRCPDLKELSLPIPYRTTEGGLTNAFRFWTQLECLDVSFFSCIPHGNVFKIVGENCPSLTELKVCASYFDKQTGMDIAASIPGLKKFSLRCAIVTVDGAEAILDLMVNLEELYICICKPGRERPARLRFRPVIMYDPRLQRKFSRLPEYHVCYNGECDACPASTLAP